jgi:hypothetical protein
MEPDKAWLTVQTFIHAAGGGGGEEEEDLSQQT